MICDPDLYRQAAEAHHYAKVAARWAILSALISVLTLLVIVFD